jgi:glycosyltransferase 2 family protein
MRRARLLLPALGMLLLGYLIGRLGPEAILQHFLALKWRVPLILLLACSWHITNTIAWAFAFPPGAFRPRLRTLFMSKLAGEAVNQITPLANIGGEPLKAYLLRHESPASCGLASVVINKTGQVITGLLFTTLGLALVVLHWSLPQAIPWPIQLGLAVLLVLGSLLVMFLWRKQRRLFSSLAGLLRRLGLRTDLVETHFAQAARIDHSISHFYTEHGLRFGMVLLFHGAGWLLGATETMVILHGLGANVGFWVAFLITALSLIINTLFFFMPSNIGVMEGGQVFLLSTLGLDPAMGLSLGIIKRMRKIFWITVGWLFLTRLTRTAADADLARRQAAAAQGSGRTARTPHPSLH